jgi:hypothetical protein
MLTVLPGKHQFESKCGWGEEWRRCFAQRNFSLDKLNHCERRNWWFGISPTGGGGGGGGRIILEDSDGVIAGTKTVTGGSGGVNSNNTAYNGIQGSTGTSTTRNIDIGYLTGADYITTQNASQFETTDWSAISSITFTQSTPGTSTIKYLVSFNNRTTWKYWNGSSWQTTTLANISTNGNTKAELEALSSSNWSSANGFASGSTSAIDFAIELTSSDEQTTPALTSIEFGYTYTSYITTNPTVTVVESVALPYSTLTSLGEELGPNNVGSIEYQISNDNGTTWYYYNGSAWTEAPATTFGTYTNTATEITGAISAFSDLGSGIFSFKAFLHASSISTPVELDTVLVGYTYQDPVITITSPNSNSWSRGISHDITWTEGLNSGATPDNGEFDDMTITLIDSEAVETPIVEKLINPGGTYTWAVPSNQALGTYTIRVKSNITNVHYDLLQDDSSVTIQNLPVIAVTTPNGGETLKAGETIEITWTNSGTVDAVNLYYSDDNGSTWNSISSDETNDESYFWIVPEAISDTVLVKVEATESILVFDISDAPFEILKNLIITSPNGGETLIIGEAATLTWETYGLINDIQISVSDDDFVTYEVIESSIPNNDTYSWTVPSTLLSSSSIGSNWKIRITDVLGDAVDGDTSDAVFSISNMRIISPALDDIVQYGSTEIIEWQVNPTITTLDIYAIINGGIPELIASDVSSISGTYPWIVNSSVSDSVQLRLVSSDDAEITATSQSFSITASTYITDNTLSVTYPTSSDQLIVGTTAPIAWDIPSAIWPRVHITYSTDNFVSDFHVVATDIENTGTYSWTVPNNVQTGVSLKVVSTDLASDEVISDGFDIIGDSLSVSNPSGVTSFVGGRYVELSWSLDAGTINTGDYTLSYSTDNFATSTSIESGLASSGTKIFQIPAITTSNFDVRITYNGSPGFYTELSNLSISSQSYSLSGILLDAQKSLVIGYSVGMYPIQSGVTYLCITQQTTLRLRQQLRLIAKRCKWGILFMVCAKQCEYKRKSPSSIKSTG